jgi:NTE family protein
LTDNAADDRAPEEGIALCLSGGGYRAMLFHLGSLWRLNEAGLLPQLSRISSVSGGSITAGALGVRWHDLAFDTNGVAQRFDVVVRDVQRVASTTIDVASGIKGILTPGRSIGDFVAKAYDDLLFHGATLQDLPDDGVPGAAIHDARKGPRFVVNATNLQSGALWRFSKPYMRDYRVGEVKKPRTPLCVAVAASSAFPPFLAPVHLRLDPSMFEAAAGEPLRKPPYTTNVILVDGGVYDNLGLEPAWKRYKTILVSNGGAKLGDAPSPPADWVRMLRRVLDVIDNQVGSLRVRELIDSFSGTQPARRGAYWGIRTDIAEYGVQDCLACPHEKTMTLASIATRLGAMDERLQRRLINWGYAVTDAALRCRLQQPRIATAKGFPYQREAVG